MNMESELVSTLAKEERKFLHDVASPLATLNLLLETAVNKAQSGGIPADFIERLKKAQNQIERINSLVRDRREILIHRSEGPTP